MNRQSVALVLLACTFQFAGCGDDPAQPQPGQIKVVVVDLSKDIYLSDVPITLKPDGTVLQTDENGIAVFDVPPGDYFIDAIVPGGGLGEMYHVPVTVRSGMIEEVILRACLICA